MAVPIVAMVAGGVFASACSRENADIPQLYIVSPHGSDIRHEFEQAFSDWHQQHFGTPVHINWPDIGGGGTGNITRYLEAQYKAGPSSGYDMVWGGGSATFEIYRKAGFLVKPELPDAVLNSVPADIFGTPLHGAGNLWISATMSNFGIVVNKDRLADMGLAMPRTWADLTGAGWFRNLSLADPSKSGSVLTSYDMVFAQYGWEAGWGDMVRMFANAEAVRDSGSAPADDVGSANAIAGIAIDFFGRKEVVRVGKKIVTFIIPAGGSTIDPEPIAVLKGAPHAKLAAEFEQYVLSEEGQKLWTFRAGTPGGPRHFVLGRLSILPQLYKNDAQYMFDPTDPFSSAEPLKADARAQGYRRAFLGDLIKAALVDNHAALKAARKAVMDAGDPPDLLARFDTLPDFAPARLDASGNLVHDPARPVTAKDLGELAAEFKPTDPRMKGYAERLQTGLTEGWRQQFGSLFESIRAEAERRRAAK